MLEIFKTTALIRMVESAFASPPGPAADPLAWGALAPGGSTCNEEGLLPVISRPEGALDLLQTMAEFRPKQHAIQTNGASIRASSAQAPWTKLFGWFFSITECVTSSALRLPACSCRKSF